MKAIEQLAEDRDANFSQLEVYDFQWMLYISVSLESEVLLIYMEVL